MRHHEFVNEEETLDPEEALQKQDGISAAMIATKRGRRWPAAEEFIIKHPVWAVEYAAVCMRQPWPELEELMTLIMGANFKPGIADDTIQHWWNWYTPSKMMGQMEKYKRAIYRDQDWPLGNNIVLNSDNPEIVSRWALDVIDGLWPAAEPVLLRDPSWAIGYAEYYMKGRRWPEFERKLLNQLEEPNASATLYPIAARYALNVLFDRWPEAEKYIVLGASGWHDYCRDLLGIRGMMDLGKATKWAEAGLDPLTGEPYAS
jgi:hypothetical protein